ncbi:MAG: C25 family cysteine peptidase [Planctomycetota bacterium]|jgi:hypothetical protein
MIRLGCLLLFCATLQAQDLLVIAPQELQPALKGWREHREGQGHRIAVHAPEPELAALVKRIHRASGGKLRFVLLLGDVKRVACAYVPARAIKPWERDPRIATDNPLADLDGDGLPELAVGRLPADDLAEAATMLRKVVAYEKSTDFSPWRRRLNLIAGVGGFGRFADWALEQATITVMRNVVPAAYDVHVTHANERSPFCPPPAKAAEAALERFNEGALFVAYVGHGTRHALDRMHYRNRWFDIFTEDHAYRLQARRGAPIVFFCACSTGHLDAVPDSLAEIALKQPAGPVAIYAASRISMPYANGMLAKELIDVVVRGRAGTVGEALREAKHRLMLPVERWDETRKALEQLAFIYQTPEKRRQERAEHLHLYNLLGDPATRIPHPAPLQLEGPEEIVRGGRLKIVGRTEVAGKVLVELVRERSPLVPQRDGDDDDAFARAYARANAWVKSSATTTVDRGRFAVELEVPADLNPGPYHVRAYVAGTPGAAMGARAVRVAAEEE